MPNEIWEGRMEGVNKEGATRAEEAIIFKGYGRTIRRLEGFQLQFLVDADDK